MQFSYCLEGGLQTQKEGGLGVLNLKIQNEALLLKSLHKFYNRADTPWVHLLWNTYYTGRIPYALAPCGSFWWKDIFKLNDLFRGVTRAGIVSGSTVLFWKDAWISEELAITHPRAFSFALQEDISVQAFLTADNLASLFHLPLSPQAMDEIRSLQGITEHVTMDNSVHGDDWELIWGSSNYSSSKYYEFCFRNITPHKSFLWIWKARSTPKLKFFF